MILSLPDVRRLHASCAVRVDVYKWPVRKRQMNFLFILTHFIYCVKSSNTHLFYHFRRNIHSLNMRFLFTHVRRAFSISGCIPSDFRFLFGLTTRSSRAYDRFLRNLEIVGWLGKVVSSSSLKAHSARSFLEIFHPTFCRRSNSLKMACLSAFVK